VKKKGEKEDMKKMIKGNIGNFLRELAVLRDYKTKRVSSWDRTGGNRDCISIPAGEKAVLADIKGAGCITHIWVTIACRGDLLHLRKIMLRMFWDGEENPSVEVPIGDFFGLGHGRSKNFSSLLFARNPRNGTGMNCYFPMPFSDGARIEVQNECKTAVDAFFYYIDYEEYDALENDLGRFHAQWRMEKPCEAVKFPKRNEEKNLTGEENYMILEAEGKGHYIGCVLNVDSAVGGWYGEGDDMIFIDGEKWPPSYHGTGTEDYFCGAWGPDEEYSGLYTGLPLVGTPNYLGETSMYRLHITDSVRFQKSIRVTIEHGHANNRSDDFSSVAYWYQTEPHKSFPEMPQAEQRIPRMPPEFFEAERKYNEIWESAVKRKLKITPAMGPIFNEVQKAMAEGRYAQAVKGLDKIKEMATEG